MSVGLIIRLSGVRVPVGPPFFLPCHADNNSAQLRQEGVPLLALQRDLACKKNIINRIFLEVNRPKSIRIIGTAQRHSPIFGERL